MFISASSDMYLGSTNATVVPYTSFCIIVCHFEWAHKQIVSHEHSRHVLAEKLQLTVTQMELLSWRFLQTRQLCVSHVERNGENHSQWKLQF